MKYRDRPGIDEQLLTLRSYLSRDIRPLREALQEFGRRQAELARPVQELRGHIESATAPVRHIAERLRELQRRLAPAIAQVSEAFARLPDSTRVVLVVLAKHGRFVAPDLPIRSIWEAESALEVGDSERADQIMMAYIESSLSDIRETIVAAFPSRAVVLEKAFRAYQREDYELSMPVRLAQADGIVNEVIGLGLYKKDKGVPAIRTFLDTLATDRFLSALHEPLRVCLPLTASAAARSQISSGLNRHQVLHGEDVEYGTKKFGLQAISLVAYVV
jgi:hypothetical protein